MGGASVFGTNITNSIATSTQIGPTNAAKLTILGADSTVGYVGIGTTSPYAKLSVVGQVVGEYFTATSTTATSTLAGALMVGTTTIPSSAKFAVDGFLSVRSSNNAVVIGDTDTSARGTRAVDIQPFGSSNVASGNDSIAIGYNVRSSNTESIAIGASAYVSGQYGIGLGRVVYATALNSLAVGTQTYASGAYSSAFGALSAAYGYQAQAIGYQNTVNAGGASAFGNSINNSIATSTQIGPTDAAKVTILGADSTVGYVGIGTTSPYAKLSVVGEIVGSHFSATSTSATSKIGGLLSVTGTGTSTMSGNLHVVGTIRSAYSYVGDLIFSNDFRFVEEASTSPMQKLYLTNEHQDKIFTVESSGNVGIGTTSPLYKLHVAGDVAATAFVNVSTQAAKKDISYLGEEDKTDILSKLQNIKVAEYHYKTESESSPLRLGLIAEESPFEVLSVDGKGVDIYKLSTFILAGVQQLSDKVESMENRIVALEGKIGIAGVATTTATSTPGALNPVGTSTATSTDAISLAGFFEKIGIFFTETVSSFKDIIANVIRAKSVEVEDGITIKDKKTGEYYCVMVVNGAMKNVKGTCAQIAEEEREEAEQEAAEEAARQREEEARKAEEAAEETATSTPATGTEGGSGDAPQQPEEVTEEGAAEPAPTETAAEETAGEAATETTEPQAEETSPEEAPTETVDASGPAESEDTADAPAESNPSEVTEEAATDESASESEAGNESASVNESEPSPSEVGAAESETTI